MGGATHVFGSYTQALPTTSFLNYCLQAMHGPGRAYWINVVCSREVDLEKQAALNSIMKPKA